MTLPLVLRQTAFAACLLGRKNASASALDNLLVAGWPQLAREITIPDRSSGYVGTSPSC